MGVIGNLAKKGNSDIRILESDLGNLKQGLETIKQWIEENGSDFGSNITTTEGHRLSGTTIVDVDDNKPIMRENGTGDYILCATFLGIPYLKYIGHKIADIVTEIEYSFTIDNGNVILKQL